MSLLTFILAIGAVLVVAIQIAIAVWYRRRVRTILRPSARPQLRKDVPAIQLAILSVGGLGALVGLVAPVVLPESTFARWLREPYAQLVYFVWCYAGMRVLTYGHAVSTVFWRRRRGEAADESP